MHGRFALSEAAETDCVCLNEDSSQSFALTKSRRLRLPQRGLIWLAKHGTLPRMKSQRLRLPRGGLYMTGKAWSFALSEVTEIVFASRRTVRKAQSFALSEVAETAFASRRTYITCKHGAFVGTLGSWKWMVLDTCLGLAVVFLGAMVIICLQESEVWSCTD